MFAMTLPDRDASSTFSFPILDYSPVIDPTTDVPAAGMNPLAEDVAQLTQISPRAFARFTPAGTGTPVLAASGTQHWAMWGNGAGVAPTVARSGLGVYTMTWPTTVNDNIPSGKPGYNANGHSVNLLTSWVNVEGSAAWHVQSQPTSANVVTIWIFNTSFSAADPNGPTFAVYAI